MLLLEEENTRIIINLFVNNAKEQNIDWKRNHKKPKNNAQNNNMLHWKKLKHSALIAVISFANHAFNTHCEEYELIQEAETFLPLED